MKDSEQEKDIHQLVDDYISGNEIVNIDNLSDEDIEKLLGEIKKRDPAEYFRLVLFSEPELLCQSCGAPIHFEENEENFGTQKDGTKNKDFCSDCYENGEYRFNATMEEMADLVSPYVSEAINNEVSADEMKELLLDVYPDLKRWKKNTLEESKKSE